MLEILQFYASSFPTWLGITIGIYVVAEAAVKLVSVYKDK
jgi:hypothetical protein